MSLNSYELNMIFEQEGLYGVLCVFLLVACYFDYKQGRIPNVLQAILLGIGVMYCLVFAGPLGVLRFGVIAIGIMLLLFPLFRIGTLGGGDVKLLGICGGYFPVNKVALFLLFVLVAALLVSLFHFAKQKDLRERLEYFCSYITDVCQSGTWKVYFYNQEEKRKSSICMAGPILCSALLYLGGVY